MDFNMEWNVICRVCMQEGSMRSIFEEDSGSYIYEKIMFCSSVEIRRGMNLPEQICSNCLEELNIAYHFRNNCESSDAVLQSFLQGNQADVIIPSEDGSLYKFVPPKGLAVKRIAKSTKIKEEPLDELSDKEIDIDALEEDALSNYEVEIDDSTESYIISEIDEKEIAEHAEDNYDFTKGVFIMPEIKTEIVQKDDENITDNMNIAIRPVKSRVSTNKHHPSEVFADESMTKEEITFVKTRRRKSEPKPPKICEICGNSYKYKHALDAHMRRHRNEKPFACEICGRAFVLNVELRCHMRTHTGQKPYACRYCDRRFSDYGCRIKHERTHTGERPYVCKTCGKAFAYSYGLSSHILTHTGEKPWSCELCGKRFTKKHHLKAHMNTHIKHQLKATKVEKVEIVSNIHDIDATIMQENCSAADVMAEATTVEVSNEEEFIEMITVLTSQPKMGEIEMIETKMESVDSINVTT